MSDVSLRADTINAKVIPLTAAIISLGYRFGRDPGDVKRGTEKILCDAHPEV